MCKPYIYLGTSISHPGSFIGEETIPFSNLLGFSAEMGLSVPGKLLKISPSLPWLTLALAKAFIPWCVRLFQCFQEGLHSVMSGAGEAVVNLKTTHLTPFLTRSALSSLAEHSFCLPDWDKGVSRLHKTRRTSPLRRARGYRRVRDIAPCYQRKISSAWEERCYLCLRFLL